jgi:hypothetical protein
MKALKIFGIVAIIVSLFVIYWYEVPIRDYSSFATVNITEGQWYFYRSTDLNFGVVRKSNSAWKKLNIENPYSHDILVKISSSGNITELISYPPELFVPPYTNTTLNMSIVSTNQTPEGTYNGNVRFRVFRR